MTVIAPEKKARVMDPISVCVCACECVHVCQCVRVCVRELIQVHKYMQINTVHALTIHDGRSSWVMDPISVCVWVCVCVCVWCGVCVWCVRVVCV